MTPTASASWQADEKHSLRLRIAAGLGLAGIVLVFLLGLRSPTALYAGLALALVAAAIAAERTLPALLREPLVWATAVLAAWVFLRGWLDLASATQRGLDPDPDAIWHHVRYTPLIAVLIGLWLAAWWQYRQAILLCAGIAACIYVINTWERLARGLPGGERPFASAFGEAGIIAGTIIVFMVALVVLLLQVPRAQRSLPQWASLGLAIGVSLFLAFVFIASQARAAWLAMLGTLLLLAVYGGWYLWRHAQAHQRRVAGIACGGGLALAAVAVALSWDIIASRMLRDSGTIAVLLSGNVTPENLPGGSLGDRYRMFRQGLIDIGNHPVWGVGPASIRDMLHEIWGKDRGGSGNYHSTWLNLMVAMGLPWTMLWLAVHVWIIGRAVRELAVRHGETTLAMALLGAALVQFGTLTFQVRIWSVNGSVLYLIVMSVACAVLLHRAVNRAGLVATDHASKANSIV